MLTSFEIQHELPSASGVRIENERIVVALSRGGKILLPLRDYPNLKSASADALKNFRMLGEGKAIVWPELGEDLLVKMLIEEHGITYF